MHNPDKPLKSTRNSGAATIPSFALYGEQEAGAEIEFVHIEDIASRSSRYNWEIQSHTHRGLFQTLFILDGKAFVKLDDLTVDVVGPAVITLPAGVVHAFVFAPETHGYVLTVAEQRLFEGSGAQSGALHADFRTEPRLVDLEQADRDTARRIGELLEQILAEFRGNHPERGLMFDWLVRAVLLLVTRKYTQASTLPASSGGRVELFTRFREMVERHYQEHWPLARYAKGMNVTESRLNRLCRNLAGKSAHEIIADRLLLEAKRRLIYIAAPVSRLAYELGFQDPAYFCRFFKKQTGITPSAFRRGGRDGIR